MKRLLFFLLSSLGYIYAQSEINTSYFHGTMTTMGRPVTTQPFTAIRYDSLHSITFEYNLEETIVIDGADTIKLDKSRLIYHFTKQDQHLSIPMSMKKTGDQWCDSLNHFTVIDYLPDIKVKKEEQIVYCFSPEYGIMTILSNDGKYFCQFTHSLKRVRPDMDYCGVNKKPLKN